MLSPVSACFTFLMQPVARSREKGREPPSLPILWHQIATYNTARERARDGLERKIRANRAENQISRPGGTVSAEHLYLTSIISALLVFLFPLSTGCSPPPSSFISLALFVLFFCPAHPHKRNDSIVLKFTPAKNDLYITFMPSSGRSNYDAVWMTFRCFCLIRRRRMVDG